MVFKLLFLISLSTFILFKNNRLENEITSLHRLIAAVKEKQKNCSKKIEDQITFFRNFM